MLKKLILKNFKTFKNETVIDFEATKFKGIIKNNVCDGVVKGGVILGSNAVGKTSILDSIKLLLTMLFSDSKVPFPLYVCMFGDSDETELSYEFLINKNKILYTYIFNVDNTILSEKLELNDEVILDRNQKYAEVKVKNDKIKYNSKDYDKSILFLKKYYFVDKFSNNKTLKDWMSFLENSAYFNSYNKESIIYNFNKKSGLDFFEDIDNVDYMNKLFNDNNFSTQIKYESEYAVNSKYKINFDNHKMVFVKKGKIDCWLPLMLESEGNQTLVHMLPILKHAISANAMILFDEFSSGFSNELEEFIIKFLMNNMDYSQAFFVTHSTNVLKSTILRPDQIYNVIFSDEEGSTVLRASSESPRETQNYEKMYLGGVFGRRTKYGKNSD